MSAGAPTNEWNVRINARQFGGVRGDFAMGARPEFIPATTLRPDHVVDDHDSLTVGDHTIELHHARIETDDHLWGWVPERKWLFTGDFVIWNLPNTGNPQKVQRYPIDLAAALRAMAERGPELLLPAHGLPIEGRDRVKSVLTDIAAALERLVAEVVEMMNAGEVFDTIVRSVHVPDDVLAKACLRPLYDEPEFVVRNIWRQFGGWWDGAPSRLEPAPDAVSATELADLTGGVAALHRTGDAARRHRRPASRMPPRRFRRMDAGVRASRAMIYRTRRAAESSLMAKGMFAGAARESEAVTS